MVGRRLCCFAVRYKSGVSWVAVAHRSPLSPITESWAINDITYAELRLEGYVMFRKDRIGRRGGGVLLYIKELKYTSI